MKNSRKAGIICFINIGIGIRMVLLVAAAAFRSATLVNAMKNKGTFTGTFTFTRTTAFILQKQQQHTVPSACATIISTRSSAPAVLSMRQRPVVPKRTIPTFLFSAFSSEKETDKSWLWKHLLVPIPASAPTTVRVRTFTTRTTTHTTPTTHTQGLAEVHIAVGSNLGHRFQNIDRAIDLLLVCNNRDHDQHHDQQHDHVRLVRTSMLHETLPMYVTNQSAFLNAVVQVQTNLTPQQLLQRIKSVEKQLGRRLMGEQEYVPNGPRPVDLDILLYKLPQTQTQTPPQKPKSGTSTDKNKDDDSSTTKDDDPHHNVTLLSRTTARTTARTTTSNSNGSLVMDSPDLIIPHPRMLEREFVMAPLSEIAGFAIAQQQQQQELCHPILKQPIQKLFYKLLKEQRTRQQRQQQQQQQMQQQERVLVLPLPRNRLLYMNETLIMGILNVTPDSFSDGGMYITSVDRAVQRALEMVHEGASIVDIGGESTRPGAQQVALQEELDRTIPVIQAIRTVSDVPISIDTRRATVARAAIEAGADIVNDVSGGTFDPEMLPTVANLRVPIVLMHMQGTPETMQSLAHNYTDSVVEDVTRKLQERCAAAEAAGIPRWMQIVDPGIGFAKDTTGNLSLLKHLNDIRYNLGTAGSTPILLGTSRKGFIGKLTDNENPQDRDYGSVASCIAAMCLKRHSFGGKDDDDDEVDVVASLSSEHCTILRVHNVKAMKDAAKVVDAIRRA